MKREKESVETEKKDGKNEVVTAFTQDLWARIWKQEEYTKKSQEKLCHHDNISRGTKANKITRKTTQGERIKKKIKKYNINVDQPFLYNAHAKHSLTHCAKETVRHWKKNV